MWGGGGEKDVGGVDYSREAIILNISIRVGQLFVGGD